MSKTLNPIELIDYMSKNNITKSEASNILFTLIDESKSGTLRANYIQIFHKMELKNEKVFKFIENLLISDEDEEVRISAAKILMQMFPENILNPLAWIIRNDKSVMLIRLIHNCLQNYDNLYNNELKREIQTRYNEIAANYGVTSKEAEFLMDIGLNLDSYTASHQNSSRTVIFGKNIIAVIKQNHIRALSLTSWKPANIPFTVQNLEKLNYLNLSCNKLKILPRSMDMLTRLKYLDLGWNNFTSIPSFLAKVNSLKNLRLDLAHNQIKTIPNWINRLKSLTYLNLRDNKIQSVPKTIGDLKNLQYLDLRENKIESIPESIGSLTSLLFLWLTNNRISHLPNSIGSLKSLKILDVGNNNLKTLPESLSLLESLEYLNIKKNHIKKILQSIQSLKKLKTIRF